MQTQVRTRRRTRVTDASRREPVAWRREAAIGGWVAAAFWLSCPARADAGAGSDVAAPRVVVTATRERALLAETPASVGVVSGQAIRDVRPTHPSQIMSQVPGVAVGVTNGEGHTTAIRQGFTTNPVYLFLEDGVPTRSTGFFNHNALYEINVPQAGGIEVTRGPGSALYGSDAIGGIVNVLTREPPPDKRGNLSGEVGSFGWRRWLADAGGRWGRNGLIAGANVTSTDGWRDKTAYDRRSATLRWDHDAGGGARFVTVLAYSDVDQQTGANSPLVRTDYENNPTRNNFPIAFRKVQALRLSTNYEAHFGPSLLSLTPYFRDDSMDLLASFALSFDPTVYNTSNRSYGLQAKWRTDFAPARTRFIAGADIETSPGSRREDRLSVTTVGTGASRIFTSYTVGPRIYDYDVTFRGVSPYVHAESSPAEKLRLTAGLRYDHLSYRADNHLASTPVSAGGRFYGQAEDGTVSFSRLSPKFGATYALAATTHLYASYHYGFRAPSESQLFRPASAATSQQAIASARSALGLKPIVAVQKEAGIRGDAGVVSYNVAVYDLVKRDDIVTLRDNATNLTQSVNAGRTRHRGIEAGLDAPLSGTVMIAVAFSYSKHTYEQWAAFNAATSSNVDFSGKTVESAPRLLANTRLTWMPADTLMLEAEWIRLGSYWLDQANTAKYEGHDLVNLRGNWRADRHLVLFASVYNLADRRYADSASISSSAPVFSPGLPRVWYAGAELKW